MESLYIVDVSVLVKGLRAPSVSFFSKDNPEVGSVVTVPFRNQSRPALVVGVSSARQAKTAIKSASFSLKKVSMSEGVCIFSRAGVNTLFSLADFYATSPGEVLRALFPAFLTLHINELATVSWGKSRKQRQQTNTKTRASYLEAPLALRLAHYAKAAADFLAKGESTLILAPTVERVRFVSKELGKELGEKQVIELSSRLSHKRLLESWNRAVKTDKPVVVVATASFLALPLYNPGLYILEGESENYQSRTRPYIDARQALETLAQEGGVDILAGDFYVSAATVHHLSAVATSDAALTPPCSGNTEIIDMKPPQDEGESDTKTQSKQPRFTIFSEELLAALKETERRGEQAFLFVARRGLFPSTACSDCSELVTCPSCGAGLVLHEDKKQERFFLCHRCSFSSRANVVCQNCGSWRLAPLGIGVDRVLAELKEHFGSVYAVSHDHTKTAAQARKQVEEFIETPGSILVGTDMALEPLLYASVTTPIDMAGVVSIDARFSIPHFDIEEDILHTLLSICSISKNRFIIQTRARNNRLFDVLLEDNFSDFRKNILKTREKFSYPPFATLLSLTYSGVAKRVKATESIVEQVFEDHPDVSLATLPKRKNNQGKIEAAHVVRLKATLRDMPEVRDAVRALPPEVEVRVNPSELW